METHDCPVWYHRSSAPLGPLPKNLPMNALGGGMTRWKEGQLGGLEDQLGVWMASWGCRGQLGGRVFSNYGNIELTQDFKSNISIHILNMQLGFKEIFIEFAE